ncbi:MAG: SGNH/GDSL hydrolase family protein [Micrococcales bacterium]|nr:SGNH/GDSL hydrolase family protein [Micrococcales bacterium]MCL2666528.1 SGNH/GDSL hydrolase family protein [Micrococcales bacterium]
MSDSSQAKRHVRSSRRWAGALAQGVVAALVLVAVTGASVAAAPQEMTVVLIGDSYTSGNGAGAYRADDGSFRSTRNWGSVYADWLGTQGVQVNLVDLSHSGHNSAQVLAQVAKVPADADLVMMTVGGNDNSNFSNLVNKCFSVITANPSDCQARVDGTRASLGDVMASTREILDALDARLGPSARIVLVGYPLLSTDTSYVLTSGSNRYDAAAGIRGLQADVASRQIILIATWNLNPAHVRATFVNTQAAFAGHEPDPSMTKRNPQRWINEFFETEGKAGADGNVSSRVSVQPAEWYHPNITGHAQIAALVQQTVGVPHQ